MSAVDVEKAWEEYQEYNIEHGSVSEVKCKGLSPSGGVGGSFSFGKYDLVGHGEQTKRDCNTYLGTSACLDVEAHRGSHFDLFGRLVDCTGKISVQKYYRSCDKPSCPACYMLWAGREAKSAEYRLGEASKALGKGNRLSGQVEHFSVSFPESWWSLPMIKLRKRVIAGLYARGMSGGVLIFHGARFNSWEEAVMKGQSKGWYTSVHMHFVGLVSGGYGCRGCKKYCNWKDPKFECNGYEVRTRRENLKDHLIVEIAKDREGEKGIRKSVWGTVRYLLDHACIERGVNRPHAAVWFGSCSYRKLKVVPMVKVHRKCVICGGEMKPAHYFGSFGVGDRCFVAPFVEDGREVCELKEVKAWYSRSGSSE